MHRQLRPRLGKPAVSSCTSHTHSHTHNTGGLKRPGGQQQTHCAWRKNWTVFILQHFPLYSLFFCLLLRAVSTMSTFFHFSQPTHPKTHSTNTNSLTPPRTVQVLGVAGVGGLTTPGTWNFPSETGFQEGLLFLSWFCGGSGCLGHVETKAHSTNHQLPLQEAICSFIGGQRLLLAQFYSGLHGAMISLKSTSPIPLLDTISKCPPILLSWLAPSKCVREYVCSVLVSVCLSVDCTHILSFICIVLFWCLLYFCQFQTPTTVSF